MASWPTAVCLQLCWRSAKRGDTHQTWIWSEPKVSKDTVWHPVCNAFCYLHLIAYWFCGSKCMPRVLLLGSSGDPNLDKFHTCSQRLHDKHWQCGSNHTSHLESWSPEWGDKNRLLQKIGPHWNSSQEQCTSTSLDPASTKGAELDLQKLYRSWHSEDYDCSCACSIQAAEPESNQES